MILERRLQRWVGEGLITPAQKEAILAYEESAPRKSWVLFGVTGIGVTAIVTGIISLIAANWDVIPPMMKLASYFFWQTVLGVAFLKYENRPGIVRETFLSLFALTFLAGIGLVGQIYHLQSDGWQALLFWCGLALPATWLSRSRLLPETWMLGLTAAVWIWIEAHAYRQWIDAMGVGVAVAYVVAAAGIFRYHGAELPSCFKSAALRWGVLVLGAMSAAANGFYYGELKHFTFSGANLALTWVTMGIAVLAAATSQPKFSRNAFYAIAGALFLLPVYYTIPLLWPEIGEQRIAGCLGFVVIWSFLAAAAAFTGRRRIYDAATLVIAIRIIVVYFEVFGSLAATGAGLIFSGVVILAGALAWHRYRTKLATWLGGKA